MDSSGATLFDTSGPSVVSKFGSSVHLNRGDIFVGVTGSEHVKVSSTGVELKDDSTVYGKFAATSTFGQTGTSSPFVEIASGVIKIKNSSHTFVSASSAGLFTSGSINADKGIIGGFDLSWWYPDQPNRLLLTFTDQTSGDDIEQLATELQSWVSEVVA